MYKGNIYAIDGAGIARVYGHGPTRDEAITQCRIACVEYLRDRPDIDSLGILENTDPSHRFSYRSVMKVAR